MDVGFGKIYYWKIDTGDRYRSRESMKKDIHPEYRPVVFRDTASGTLFMARSTVKTNQTVTYEDGNEYPVFDVEISSASHPFFTGKQKLVDTTGRVERFKRRYNIK
jgi:large subunit ribosomal protein L31